MDPLSADTVLVENNSSEPISISPNTYLDILSECKAHGLLAAPEEAAYLVKTPPKKPFWTRLLGKGLLAAATAFMIVSPLTKPSIIGLTDLYQSSKAPSKAYRIELYLPNGVTVYGFEVERF